MNGLLEWDPILWTLRIGLLIVVSIVLGVFTLLAARFFRWKHVKRLLTADLPEVRSVQGEFGGTKAGIELVQRHDVEVRMLADQVADLRSAVGVLIEELRREKRG